MPRTRPPGSLHCPTRSCPQPKVQVEATCSTAGARAAYTPVNCVHSHLLPVPIPVECSAGSRRGTWQSLARSWRTPCGDEPFLVSSRTSAAACVHCDSGFVTNRTHGIKDFLHLPTPLDMLDMRMGRGRMEMLRGTKRETTL